MPIDAGNSKFWLATVVALAVFIPAAVGAQAAPVPNVRGCDFTMTEGVLAQEAVPYDFEQAPQNVDSNVVVAQESWEPGFGVTLTFFDASPDTPPCAWTVVPSVIGLSARDAAAALRLAQLSPEFDESQAGTATSQSLAAGTFATRDTAVPIDFAITVIDPPRIVDPVTDPDPRRATTTTARRQTTTTSPRTTSTTAHRDSDNWWVVPWDRPDPDDHRATSTTTTPARSTSTTDATILPVASRRDPPSPMLIMLAALAIVGGAVFTGLAYEFVNRETRRRTRTPSPRLRARTASTSGTTLPPRGQPSFSVIARLQTRGTGRFLEGR
jgi:hypothetical protein